LDREKGKYFVEAFTSGVELSLSGTLALSDLSDAHLLVLIFNIQLSI
jgi:hypothetical protein